MRYQIFRLIQYLRGWINYFGIGNCYNQCVKLDHWIRRHFTHGELAAVAFGACQI